MTHFYKDHPLYGASYQIPDMEKRIVEEDDIPQHYLDLLQNET